MKIESINFISADALPKTQIRNTEAAQQTRTILENIAKCPEGKALVLLVDSVQKHTRQSLQRKLQDAGAKVLVKVGAHKETGKPVLFIEKLSTKQWNEWKGNDK